MSKRVACALWLALLYALLFPTPFFWICLLVCSILGFWSNWFYLGLGIAAFGVLAGLLFGFFVAPYKEAETRPRDQVEATQGGDR